MKEGGLMENWREIYQRRLVTADEAVKYIPNNSRVLIGHAANQPPALVDAMCRNYQQYQNVELVHWVTLYDSKYCAPEMQGHLRFNGLFISGSNRKAVAENLADFTPTYFGQCPRYFRDGTLPIDAVLISVTPPNEHGYCSLGVSVGGTMPATRVAKLVIAQINRNLPRTYGDSHIHVSQIDFMVEEDSPLPIMAPGQVGEVEAAIGRHCAALIEDGSTLQLGIGSIPDAVLQALTDKKDLGIHSEMIADGVIDLCEKGVINGAQKTIHKGKIVVAFLMGSQRLYDFVNNNPDVEVLPVDHVNDPWVIGQNHKMVSINSCLQVDFNGQVNSESIGIRQFSGVGGQLDYIRGSFLSPGGKAILAMPSTAKHGEVSRIVPVFEAGTTVTTPRTDTHYIVTEYGAVNLRGKNLRERAKLLIGIAHPKFRAELWEEYRKRYGEDANYQTREV
jgi:4-hydroxybutyrate CoA-transferase